MPRSVDCSGVFDPKMGILLAEKERFELSRRFHDLHP